VVAHGKVARAVVDDAAAVDDAIVDAGLQMLPIVCVGGDTGFKLEADALAAAVDEKVDFGTGVRRGLELAP
jgi:hypothetical protein